MLAYHKHRATRPVSLGSRPSGPYPGFLVRRAPLTMYQHRLRGLSCREIGIGDRVGSLG